MTDRPKQRTPASGTPEFVKEEITGVYEGDELKAIRARRSTDERIGRLEDKHDKLVESVTDVRVCVGEMNGKMDTVLDFIKTTQSENHRTERMRIGSRAKIIVAIVGAVGTGLGILITTLAGCV